jgi:penicillin G amidase
MINRILRYLGWAVGGLVALVLVGALVFANRLYASLPQTTGTMQLAGLGAEASIARDANGVPHIFAQSDRDGFYAMGVAHAQDRLWQMEITRRALRGRLAEILGEPGLSTDIFFRTMGLGPASDTAVSNLPADVQDALQAYADGINAVISAPGFVPPPEFQILMFAPEPWQPADTVVVYKAIALDLFGNAFEESSMAALTEHLGAQRTAEFIGRYPDDAPRSLTMADIGIEASALPPAEEIPPSIGPEDTGRDGSNNWVLSGSRTASGLPILANDPHLGLAAPAIWYLARLTTPNGSVVGATLPGTPFVTLGRTDEIAWCWTRSILTTPSRRAVTSSPCNGCSTSLMMPPPVSACTLSRPMAGMDSFRRSAALSHHNRTWSLPIAMAISASMHQPASRFATRPAPGSRRSRSRNCHIR